jgi:hypothetical protein
MFSWLGLGGIVVSVLLVFVTLCSGVGRGDRKRGG